ncbi:MAG: endonuclease/exonuclease/phosphatase family protein [Bacteroidales bacterium]|nr:endonuclease/exonuclease/phosphatase family protein [Bacteroidales bacterium]
MRTFIYKILLYITYLLVFALAISYLSVHVNPEKVWWMALFGLAFPYLLFLNVISAILWFVSHKQKVVIIPLTILLLGLGYSGRVIQLPIKKSGVPDSASFNLLSYNIRAFNIYKWTKSDSAGIKILKLIQKENPQIICLQEFLTDSKNEFNFKNIEKMMSNTPYHHYYGHYSDNNKNFMGLAFFSSYPIVKRGVIPFENTFNASIYCDVVIDNDTIRIYNNHLQSIKLGAANYALIDTIKFKYSEQQLQGIKDISVRLRDAFIIRAKQAKRIKEHAIDSPYPVIICGDFNDTPISFTYQILKKGFYDAFIESGRGIGNTYIGKLPSYRIDYILHSNDFESSSFETIKDQYSDHYPIKCKLRLSRQK